MVLKWTQYVLQEGKAKNHKELGSLTKLKMILLWRPFGTGENKFFASLLVNMLLQTWPTNNIVQVECISFYIKDNPIRCHATKNIRKVNSENCNIEVSFQAHC